MRVLHLFMLIASLSGAIAVPHIVMVLVDDMGWNDVSWNNDYVIMGNISRLASEGVILNNAYAQEVCTPSRAAFLTGYYPIKIGMQEGTVTGTQTNGLPLNLTLLPTFLKESANYSTYMIGKWHLGMCNDAYTPTKRGFDSHYGFYLNAITYETHEATERSEVGYDYRDDLTLNVAANGSYATSDFTDAAIAKIAAHDPSVPMFLYAAYNAPHSPFEVSSEYTNMYPGLADGNRKTYLGMITALDYQIYRLEQALINKGMWNDTVFVFYSDNGGAAKQSGQSGNNYPLRGKKSSLWEGGYKVPAFVRSNLLNNTGYQYDGLVHITDMFASFVYLAGGNSNVPSDIDGQNVWDAISGNTDSPRTDMVYNVIMKKYSSKAKNSVVPQAAVRSGKYKLIEGVPGVYVGLESWVKPPENSTDVIGNITNYAEYTEGNSTYYLFDLDADPYETTNIASTNTLKFNAMKVKLREAKATVIQAIADDTSTAGSPTNNDPPSWNPGFCTV